MEDWWLTTYLQETLHLIIAKQVRVLSTDEDTVDGIQIEVVLKVTTLNAYGAHSVQIYLNLIEFPPHV